MKILHFVVVAAALSAYLMTDEVTAVPTNGAFFPAIARLLYKFNGNYVASVVKTDSDGNSVVSNASIVNRPVKFPGISDPTFLYYEDEPDSLEYDFYTVTYDGNGIMHSHDFSVPKADVERGQTSDDGVLVLPDDATIIPLDHCSATFVEEENGNFEAPWDDCVRHAEDESNILVMFRHIGCDGFDLVINLPSHIAVNHFQKVGDRYLFPAEIEEKISSTPNPCDS